jgi:hypothetical protein
MLPPPSRDMLPPPDMHYHIQQQQYEDYQMYAEDSYDSSNIIQLQQKSGLPKWLKEELELMERKKSKEKAGLGGETTKIDRPSWMEELDDRYDDQDELLNESHVSTRSRTLSPLSEHAINNEIEPAEEAITGVDHYDNSSMIDEMKYLLTEVLLDVTSEEINTISTETIDEFKGLSMTDDNDGGLSNLLGKY